MTDFEIVPDTPATFDIATNVTATVETEATPGVTGLNARVAAVETRTVAGVTAVAGDYPLAALRAAGLAPRDILAVQVASATVVDGTATDVDLVTANGYYSVPIATLTGILSDYADLGLTVYVGGDGGDGTCVGLYSIPGDTDPWEAYTPNADAEVRFLTSERQGLLTNSDGPLTLPDPTAPATKVDSHNIAANRVQVFDDPAASPSNYTPDDGGLTLDAHLIGIDAALGDAGGAGDVTGPGSSTASNIPSFTDTTGKALADSGKAFSTDGTFASNSDAKVPTEKAVKTYADTKVDSDRSARVLGGHAAGPAITDATSGLTTGVSLLNSTVTLPTNLAAGDVVRVRASVEGVNNSGGSRTIAFTGKIGSTSAVTCSVAWSAGATTRIAIIDMMMRCTSTSAQTWDGTVAGAFPVSNTGSSAETTTSAKTFDLLMTSSSTASTQSYQVKHVSVMYFPA